MAHCNGGILLFDFLKRYFFALFLCNLLVYLAGQFHLGCILLHCLHIVANAVVGRNKLVRTSVAIGLSSFFQSGKAVFYRLDLLIGQSNTVFFSILTQCFVLFQRSQCLIEEVISPGSLSHGTLLVTEAGEAIPCVKPEHACITAVIVYKVLILVCIGVCHFRRAVFPIINRYGRCFRIEKRRVEDNYQNDQQCYADQSPGPPSLTDRLLLCFFLCCKSFLVRTGFPCSLTDFLFC